MLEFGCAPARPGEAVVVAFTLTILCAQRDEIEVLLVRHVQLEPLRRLTAVAGRPSAAIDFAQDVLGDGPVALDLDVLEHRLGKAEPLREQINSLVIVLRLEDRLDDLLAPLQRAVGGSARAGSLEL